MTLLDDGTGAVAIYAVFNVSGNPVRLLVINTNYFDGTGTRTSTSVTFTGLSGNGSIHAKRMTAPSATSRVDEGAMVTIGESQSFSASCVRTGGQTLETVEISGGGMSVTVQASEALIVFL